LDDVSYKEELDSVTPLVDLIKKYQPDTPNEDRYFMMEFILWGLVENKKLSKYKMTTGMRFNDLYGSYISGLK